MKTWTIPDMPVAFLDLPFHEHSRLDMMNFRISPLPSSMDKAHNCIVWCRILQNSQIIWKYRFGPNSYISYIRLSQYVEELSYSIGKQIGNLKCSMFELAQSKLFDSVHQNDQRKEQRTLQTFEIFSVVHKWYNPRICLRNDEIVNIEQNRKLLHRQIMPNRSIKKLSVHECVLSYVTSIVLAIKISGSIDVGNGTGSSRGTPDKDIGSSKIVEQSICVILRDSCNCDVEDNSEFVVGLLKGVLANVIA